MWETKRDDMIREVRTRLSAESRFTTDELIDEVIGQIEGQSIRKEVTEIVQRLFEERNSTSSGPDLPVERNLPS